MRLRGAPVPLFTVVGAQGPMHHAAAETMFHVTPHSFVSLKQPPGAEIWPSASLITVSSPQFPPVKQGRRYSSNWPLEFTWYIMGHFQNFNYSLLLILSLFSWSSQPRVRSYVEGITCLGWKVVVLEPSPITLLPQPLPRNTLQNGLGLQSLVHVLCQSIWPLELQHSIPRWCWNSASHF